MPKKEIVDNESDGYTMSQFLNEVIRRNGGPVAIASGYFNVEGYASVKDALQEAAKRQDFRLRLLIGSDATTKRELEVAECDPNDISITNELDALSIDERYAALVEDLIAFLKFDKVEVKKNPNRFTHAKCYIFDDSVVVGSSNFTKAGLSSNIELNAVLYQPSAQQQVRDWFDRRWSKGEDAKQELVQLLEDSKFGLPLDPYTLYMKFLYEYYRPRLEELEREKGKILELASFQQDAFSGAKRIISKYNGVLIADSTGLGKTHIALELLREYVSVQRKKAIVVAPAQVLSTVWERKLMDESIKTKNLTIESTGTSSFRPEEYLDYDVVVIDESQNYRNSSTNRYKSLMKLLSGGKRKQVVLMTATPVNNSLIDLYHQLALITSGDDSHFADLGIPDLRRHFISADRKELAQGIEDIVRILDEVMVRRTRQFIVENYPDATINGKRVRFPKRQLRKEEYSLTALFGGEIYSQVLDTIENLYLVPYRTDYYLLTIEEKEKLEAEQRATLQKYGLLKRFESSVEAIKRSIERLVKFYEYFEKTLESGKILNSQAFHKVLAEMGDSIEDEAAFFGELEKIPLMPLTSEYNKAEMIKDLREDLDLLRPLKGNLDRILPFTDKKLAALVDHLVKNRVFERDSKKCLVFTQFVDTAEYLYAQLKEQLRTTNKEVGLLTGKTDPRTREAIIRNFAPRANGIDPALVAKEVDLLISTDILSEGQNLQDANYVVNYDLPWNPMKIVQRVGRVDRIGSDYDVVTACVFWPEKELEDLLGLIEKLEVKIQKASATVGVEATILGEKENPKNFNAVARISREDQALLDDMERASELLPAQTPFQYILAYLKKEGEKGLRNIPLGKRSGKLSDVNGMVVFYRERGTLEGMHVIYYDLEEGRFDHYNDVAWLLRKTECGEGAQLRLPIKGLEAFRQFRGIDEKAREVLLTAVNAPVDAKMAQKIGPKHQRELRDIVMSAFAEGKVSTEEASKVFKTLNGENLVAWEDEFAEFLDEYRRHQNVSALLASLALLFERYKIDPELRERRRLRKLLPQDLEIVGYMYLSREDFTTTLEA